MNVKVNNIDDNINELKSTLTMVTDYEQINLTSGGWIQTNYSTTDYIVNTSNYYYKIFDCSEGDMFIIYGVGTNSARLWAFVDDDPTGNILKKADANKSALTTPEYVIAPIGAHKLVINSSINRVSYKIFNAHGYKNNLINLYQYVDDEIDVSNIVIKNEIGKYIQPEYNVVSGYYTSNQSYDPPQTAGTGYSCLKIPVIPGDKLRITAKVQANSSLALALFYDKNGVYKSGYNFYDGTVKIYYDEPVTVPDGIYYVSVSSHQITPVVKKLDFIDDNLWDAIQSKPLACQYANGELKIVFKYNGSKDGIITFKPVGASNLFQFYSLYIRDNTNKEIDRITSGGTNFITAASDWVGPYGDVVVENNPDGDVSGVRFTGGWHGTDGNTGGATAMSEFVHIYIDNYQIQDSVMYGGSQVKIVTSNLIQASNTVKSDGTGRGVIRETITYKINSLGEINVETKIKILEDLTIGIYYGLQANTSKWDDTLYIDGSNNNTWQTCKDTAINGKTKENGIVGDAYFKDNAGNNMHCFLDLGYGLSNRRLIDTAKPTAFNVATNKFYTWLILNQTFTSGRVLVWRGGYRFYYE